MQNIWERCIEILSLTTNATKSYYEELHKNEKVTINSKEENELKQINEDRKLLKEMAKETSKMMKELIEQCNKDEYMFVEKNNKLTDKSPRENELTKQKTIELNKIKNDSYNDALEMLINSRNSEEKIRPEEIEINQLEYWTKKQYGEVIFDSDVDDWKEGTSVFEEKIMNKKYLLFIIEDNEGNKFGGYIQQQIEHDMTWLYDPNAFIFSLRSNGRLEGMKKFEIKDDSMVHTFGVFDQKDETLFVFGWGLDICIFKENKKNESFSIQDSYEYDNATNALIGKDGKKQSIDVKRIRVIQMK